MNNRYHLSTRILHWLMALMFFGLIAIGYTMGDIPREDPLRGTLFGWHKATGFIFLCLAFIRVAMLAFVKAPELPAAFSNTERKLTKSTKHLLYLGLVLVPLSGWGMSNFNGYPIKLGDFAVPLVFGKHEGLADLFHEIHEYAPWVLLALVVAHLTAVIYHKLEGGEKDILRRML
ncbi:cytochrome b [Simiduia agarivorans]|uniref:Cytochrome B561 n=1 Tax=Simiduia agarivorans (strain DSM 21679 / JCM 13881 / BCRC 17597 / SA1) TaxID=1117647 RepID=K4KEF6_SIMAS|nr:cytochrome b [Simiduia agarivorans]AFU97434.1 cytochrome B561 [Simiduia agarivorans SA1 = DSM 21679]